MKKVLSIILAFFYLSLSAGVALNAHYCGGKLESIGINQEQTVCCCGFSDEKSSCCENKEFKLKLDIDQQVLSLITYKWVHVFTFVVLNSTYEILENTKCAELFTKYEYPPPLKSKDIRLLNCSFIFYG